ncbi:acyl carrier protein [Streptomyces ficellus]|uniref:Acyl carrier protein n=1 Tax=Streptomyces ficellus TaxID=1977088 RepID=A0ABT7Z5W6_9ACTN|nr:acyl carrier protein [Streptomyces ficellus]MDN3294894.1 acyl carrier protein [Streptomyces ficellus]
MPANPDALVQVKSIISHLSERPVEDIKSDDRLLEDLGLDSLTITELAQQLENALGHPIDEDLLNVENTTVARCAEIAQDA